MRENRVIFVNRFYWPEQPATAQLLTDLTEGLARTGRSVGVITRLPPGFAAASQRRNGVNIERIPVSAFGRRSLAGRALDFLSFLRGARRHLAKYLQPADILVSMTDPPLLGMALAGLARSRGALHIHWVQDIFPEVAMAVSGSGAARVLLPWRNRAWRTAQACVAPGADMAAFVRAQGVPAERVSVCENWAPAGVTPADATAWRQHHGLSERFVVMYSGNLGRVHDFSGIVPLAERCRSDPRIHFVFVGEGARKAPLVRDVQAAKLANISFLPAQPRDALSVVLSAGDLHLVTLRHGCEHLVFPSKLYGIAAVGRPVLALGPKSGQLARLIVEHGFGFAHESTEIIEIANVIAALSAQSQDQRHLGQAALAFAESRGGAEHAVAHWDALLNSIAANH